MGDAELPLGRKVAEGPRRGRAALAAAGLALAVAALVPSAVPGHPSGPGAGGGTLPSGRRVSPAGEQVRVGRFPQALALAPDGGHVAVVNTGTEQSISWIDTATLAVLTTVPAHPRQAPPEEPHDVQSVFAGTALSSDGSRLWVSGGLRGSVLAFDVTPAGPVQNLPASLETASGFLGRLALSPDGATLYATDTSYRSEAFVAVDLATGTVSRASLAGHRPFALAVSSERIWVAGMLSGEIVAFDPGLQQVASAQVGERPMALALADPDLLVADANADELIVLDPQTLAVRQRVSLAALPGGLGASPNDIAVAGNVAAVSLGGANAVAVLDRTPAGWTVRGLVPAAWDPEAVALSADGGTLWVANARGDASGTPAIGLTNPGPSPITGLYGSVSRVALPADLSAWTAQVQANNAPPALPPDLDARRPPIEHVVFILRENKTYDALLGDHEGGDPRFVVFPRPNTPSLHALADRFAVLTDLHANAEASDQGHQWTTGGYVTDFVERFTAVFPRDNDCSTALWGCGNDPITYPRTGYLYDALERAGLDWRVYGEWLPLLSRGGPERPEFADNRVPGYPGYDLSIPDTERARLWEEDFRARGLPAFSFVYLPADHGLTIDDRSNPTLQQQVADNDRATGMIVEAISGSPYWARTAIFLTEDDPQGYFDHVDAQRTIGLVISPWARKGTLGVHTDSVGMVRTMAWLLGLEPWSGSDAAAAPLADVFADTADLTPFVAPPKGLGVPPSAEAWARALAIVAALPPQSGPDQIPPSIQLEFSSLATKGLTAAEFARRLGVEYDPEEQDSAEDDD